MDKITIFGAGSAASGVTYNGIPVIIVPME